MQTSFLATFPLFAGLLAAERDAVRRNRTPAPTVGPVAGPNLPATGDSRPKEVGLMTYQERQTHRHGVGGWSRTRWLVLAAVLVAVAVVVLLVLYAGGGSGGGGGGGGY